MKCIEKYDLQGFNHKVIVNPVNGCHCSVPWHVPSSFQVVCDKMHCVCFFFGWVSTPPKPGF